MSTQTAFNFEQAVRRPRARATDPDTSHEAAASISKKALSEGQKYILMLLNVFGPMTDEETWERVEREIQRRSYIPIKSPSGARSRRSEITISERNITGQIADSTLRRKTRSGRNAIVWEAV